MRCTYTINLKTKASTLRRFKLSDIAYRDNIGLNKFGINDKGNTCRKLIVSIDMGSDYWHGTIPNSYFRPIRLFEVLKRPLSKKIYSAHIPLQRYSSRKVSLKEKVRGILYESYQTTFIK